MKSERTHKGIRRDLRVALVLAGLGAALGFMINVRHPRRLHWDATWADLTADAARSAGIGRMPLGEASSAIHAHTHIVLDARSWPHYREGHIPGAISLPPAAFDARFPFIQLLLSADHPILVYGTGPQDDAPLKLATLLEEQGYHQVVLLAEGWEGWHHAERPTESGPGPM